MMSAPAAAQTRVGWLDVLWCAVSLTVALMVPVIAANYSTLNLAGGQTYSYDQIRQSFANNPDPRVSGAADQLASMAMGESSGRSGVQLLNNDSGFSVTGLTQMDKDNIYKYSNGQSPAAFAASGLDNQTAAAGKYYVATLNDPAEKKLLDMQSQGQTVGGRQIDNGMLIGCSQMGAASNGACMKSINDQCRGSGDANGQTLCNFADRANKHGSSTTPTKGNNSNSTNSSTPSDPARSNPCTCPGNHEGTDAQLMKESCPTNTSSVQNWPHTNTYYLGSPPPKVPVGTNICDPSAPQRVPDNFSPVSTDNSPSTPTNTSNTSNAGGGGGAGSGGNAHGGTVANLSKAQAAAGTGQCLGQNCQCAALVQGTSNVGSTNDWVRGDKVLGSTDLKPGTVIATFNGADGGYNTPEIYGHQHTAIYLGQNENGIQVLDQSNKSGGVQQRTIPYGSGYESAQKFYVVR